MPPACAICATPVALDEVPKRLRRKLLEPPRAICRGCVGKQGLVTRRLPHLTEPTEWLEHDGARFWPWRDLFVAVAWEPRGERQKTIEQPHSLTERRAAVHQSFVDEVQRIRRLGARRRCARCQESCWLENLEQHHLARLLVEPCHLICDRCNRPYQRLVGDGVDVDGETFFLVKGQLIRSDHPDNRHFQRKLAGDKKQKPHDSASH